MTHTPLTKAEREELRRLHDYAAGRFTMRINGENDCRVELANGLSDDERGLHARFRYATGAHAFVAIHNHLPRLLADLDAAEAERDEWKEAAKTHLAGKVDAWSQRDRAESERDAMQANWARQSAMTDEVQAQRDKCCDDYQREATRAVAAESERDTAIADRIIADSDAWVALGKPGGTYDSTCVQRLCEQFAKVKAKLAALVEALESVVQRAGCRRGMNAQELRGLLWGCEDDAKAAIAAARGGDQ